MFVTEEDFNELRQTFLKLAYAVLGSDKIQVPGVHGQTMGEGLLRIRLQLTGHKLGKLQQAYDKWKDYDIRMPAWRCQDCGYCGEKIREEEFFCDTCKKVMCATCWGTITTEGHPAERDKLMCDSCMEKEGR